jgi:CBS domain containing-hemolysin-like protein
MVFQVLLVIVLVLMNGFFVAAEFAIVKVRYSQIQLRAEKGSKLAKKAEQIISHLDTYLSATQLGITLASLGLGWIGEPVVAKIIAFVVAGLHIQLPEETIHSISLPLGFLLITMLHIVFGELAPKSIAIRKSEPTALVISYPMYLFFVVFRPFIWLMNSLSNLVLHIIGIQPVGKNDIHSAEELRLLVKQSKEGGALQAENYEIIKNAFDFTDHTARQIMIPRHQIFGFDIDLTKPEMIEKMLESGYSRIPVFQNSLDNIIGIVYAKDVFREQNRNPDFSIKDLIHPVLYVYETKRISEIMTQFQKQHLHMAVIIDEYGGTQGIITLEDILEELVGEIQDEDDEETVIVEKKEDGTYAVQATQSLIDINDYLPHPLSFNENYTTLSGLLLSHFNRIPKLNEKIVIENYEITVSKIQRRSIQTAILKEIVSDGPESDSDHSSQTSFSLFR